MSDTPNLDLRLTEGLRIADDEFNVVVEGHQIGEVVLPTGQVAGCDPFTYSERRKPFIVAVSPGTYPLRAWVAVFSRDDEESHRIVPPCNSSSVLSPSSGGRWRARARIRVS